jgi:hypothetical protein
MFIIIIIQVKLIRPMKQILLVIIHFRKNIALITLANKVELNMGYINRTITNHKTLVNNLYIMAYMAFRIINWI